MAALCVRQCGFCLSGWETLYLEQKNSGYSVNGSFAQYAVSQADYLGRIPKDLSSGDRLTRPAYDRHTVVT